MPALIIIIITIMIRINNDNDNNHQVPAPEVPALLRRAAELDSKPAAVRLVVRRLAFGLEPDAALDTLVAAVREMLAKEGKNHGSAKGFLDRLSAEGALFLSAIRRSVRHATATVGLSLTGGPSGNSLLRADEAAIDYGPYASWLFTPLVSGYNLAASISFPDGDFFSTGVRLQPRRPHPRRRPGPDRRDVPRHAARQPPSARRHVWGDNRRRRCAAPPSTARRISFLHLASLVLGAPQPWWRCISFFTVFSFF